MKNINDLKGIEKRAKNSMIFIIINLLMILSLLIICVIWKEWILNSIILITPFAMLVILFTIDKRYWDLKKYILYGKKK